MPKGDGTRKLSEADVDEIVRIYTTPNPDGTWTGVKTIAAQFGVVTNAVYQRLAQRGIPTRSIKEAYVGAKRTKPIKNLPPEGEAPPLCKCGCGSPVAWNQRANSWRAFVQGHYENPPRPYTDPAWLRHQYEGLLKSSSQIAEECGVAQGTITRRLRQFGIRVRPQAESLRLSGAVSGERNPAWNGGVTPERQRLYKTDNWSDLVKQVLQRDGYRCARCGRTKGDDDVILHTHHIAAWADYPELRFDPDNLITLCSLCHTWVHSSENTESEYIQR